MLKTKKAKTTILVILTLTLIVGVIFGMNGTKRSKVVDSFRGKIEATESGGNNTTGSRVGITLDVTEFTIHRGRNKKDNC